ncbi:MAG TPA: riboflavin synthase [Burkholderiales bacterium]|nr:riboflavin synthase [Burkholderiales bacterium]
MVHAVGRIVRLDPLEVECAALGLSDISVGDSICVQGVCLTATSVAAERFTADVSAETLRLTTGLECPGPVNLEKALALGERLGGHLVTGHVDGLGEVMHVEGPLVRIRPARDLLKYIARKGSICVDGVSLTVNGVHREAFEVNLIPHTREVTTLARLAPGVKVNLEVDLIARYVERLLSASKDV